MKYNRRKWYMLCITVLFVLLLTGCVVSEKNVEITQTNGTLQVHFMDVGQGDCILLIQDEHSMLIDAGDNDCGTRVQSYLQANSIDTLDYVIGTHPDADHIGGLDVILYKFNCNQIWMPDCSKDTKTYEDVIASAREKNYKITTPQAGDTFMLGDAKIQVLSPGEQVDYGEDSNNNSIVVKVTYGKHSFLFTGDCEEMAEADMLESGFDLQADVMKAGHHGSNTSNSRIFLEAVKPKACVISCGVENDYGHPKAEVLNHLRELGVAVYRTDEQGSIVVVSDGAELTWNTQPSESWQPGEEMGEGQTTAVSSAMESTYILNTNTMKIHEKDCSSVDEMNVKNRQETDKTIEELMEYGYEPCKRCKP